MAEHKTLELNDDELYSRYLSGDTEAGDTLMLRYGDQIVQYLDSFLKNYHDAEDLMLDCFTVILVDKPRIGEGSFRAYLFKIAHNKACSLWKSVLRRSEFSLSDEIIDALNEQFGTAVANKVTPEEEVLKEEKNTGLRNALNRIALQYREALWLVYGMEFSYDDAARIIGCGKKRIENLLLKGKKALKTELLKEGVTYADI